MRFLFLFVFEIILCLLKYKDALSSKRFTTITKIFLIRGMMVLYPKVPWVYLILHSLIAHVVGVGTATVFISMVKVHVYNLIC